jgi:hypothetical protein
MRMHEEGSKSCEDGGNKLPCELYYINFLFFVSTLGRTEGHSWIALHWRGYVWSPMQSATFGDAQSPLFVKQKSSNLLYS